MSTTINETTATQGYDYAHDADDGLDGFGARSGEPVRLRRPDRSAASQGWAGELDD